jgi:hypothetical protein
LPPIAGGRRCPVSAGVSTTTTMISNANIQLIRISARYFVGFDRSQIAPKS